MQYFERGTVEWKTSTDYGGSNESFKPYRKTVEDNTKFITVPYVPYAAETPVSR